jgi:type II secretory pathway pseudopilin PulG
MGLRFDLKTSFRRTSKKPARQGQAADEGGYALLSLILALTILSIILTSSVQPNYQLSVQREKEEELLYRGQQMAEGIARYYNNGQKDIRLLGPPNLTLPPVYGYLKELKKLKEGVTINLQEIKFVRPSAMVDPFDGKEWEPVYARDPRIMPFLQAWASETGGIIPQPWMLIAGPPVRTKLVQRPSENGSTGSTGSSGTGTTSGGTGSSNSQTGATTGQQRGNQQNRDLDDDDDDDDVNDPLAHLFSGGFSSGGSSSGLPIVGVAPRRKGQTVRAYYGLQNYEEWIFIFLPPPNRVNIPNQNQGGQQNGQQPRLQINQ